MTDQEEAIFSVLEALDATVWNGKGIDKRTIEEWLRSFGPDCAPGTDGRLQALYLLSRFTYFGLNEVRALAAALHRDCFRYPAIAQLRRANQDTRDVATLEAGFAQWLSATRFLGMGNPAESGTHILYHYRQESGLHSKLFISPDEIFDLSEDSPRLADTSIQRYVFIDDFCGSGLQATRYSRKILNRLKKAAALAELDVSVAYHVLVATEAGLEAVRTATAFTDVRCALTLDDTFRTFGSTSRYFGSVESPISAEAARALATTHGTLLTPLSPLGFNDSQLMIGFVHNTPNNTLPIFWHPGTNAAPWSAPFLRYGKKSGKSEFAS